MKNANKIVILALGILGAAIVFLAIRNDIRFNKARKQEVRQKASLDSTARTQADSLTAILNNVSDLLDSIRRVQHEHNDMMKRDVDFINCFLDQSGNVGR